MTHAHAFTTSTLPAWTADAATEAAGLALHAQLIAEAEADVTAILTGQGLLDWAAVVDRIVGDDIDDVRFVALVDGV